MRGCGRGAGKRGKRGYSSQRLKKGGFEDAQRGGVVGEKGAKTMEINAGRADPQRQPEKNFCRVWRAPLPGGRVSEQGRCSEERVPEASMR